MRKCVLREIKKQREREQVLYAVVLLASLCVSVLLVAIQVCAKENENTTVGRSVGWLVGRSVDG